MLPIPAEGSYSCRVRALLVALPLALTLGCIDFGPEREDVPGELLGDYAVTGRLQGSTCGEGALGAVDPWSFEIRLSRQGDELFWVNGREVITGKIERSTRRFSFETAVAVELEPAKAPHPGCTVMRQDRADGELHGIDDDVAGFDGTLEYGFTATEGSDCGAQVGEGGDIAVLPCAIEYSVLAERIEDAAAD